MDGGDLVGLHIVGRRSSQGGGARVRKRTREPVRRWSVCAGHQPDARLKLRFIAMLMLAIGTSVKDIAVTTGVAMKTVENWYHQS